MERKRKNDETKRVRKSDLDKKVKKSSKKGKKLKFKDKHPKANTIIKIGIIVFILLMIIGAGVLVGTFFGIFGEELKISEEELNIQIKNSTVYDADGNQLAELSGGEKRKVVSMSDMSEYLPKAYIAIEDERFESHRGVDIKRTLAATLTFIFRRGSSSFGGSTITQQLVKNLTKEDEDEGIAGALRKVKEMAKAIQVEQYLSKDQILELYLNYIFVGGDDVNGVALGAIYYFDKDVKDLSIAECAYLAGINHSPNAYNPFKEDPDGKRKEKINKRVNTVLEKMEELGYITADQHKEAKAQVDAGLPFKNGDGANVTTTMSYHTEAALAQILDQLMEEKQMSKEQAELYLYSSGLKIYTTQKSDIQSVLEQELVKETYIKERNVGTKAEPKYVEAIPTMVITDHKTGQVVAAATATGNKENRTAMTKIGDFNYPTRLAKQTGSSMKPISVITPGIATGTITAATMYWDCETRFPGMDKSMKNDDGYSNQMLSIRTGIAKSKNIINAKAFMNIGVDTSKKYCAMMGIDNLGDEGVSLALGGLDIGISPTHMAMAYATIANDGTYIQPTFYTKVTDEQGNVVLEPKQEKTEVLTKAQAYVVKSILTQPVLTGTATYCKIKGIETCAKTGTTNESYDRWLCGFTPYYTAACWYGYAKSLEVKGFGQNPAGTIWSNVMKAIHEDLPNANFEKPEGVTTATICSVSGKLAVEGQCGATYQEVFVEGTVPDSCDGHVTLPICIETGLIATAGCPQEQRSFTSLPEKEQNSAKWTNVNATNPAVPPTDTCTVHAGAATPAPGTPGAPHTHTLARSETVGPTCTSDGVEILYCSCGAEMERKPWGGKALGHNFQGEKCSRCGAPNPSYTPPAEQGGSGTGGGTGDGGDSGSGGTGTPTTSAFWWTLLGTRFFTR